MKLESLKALTVEGLEAQTLQKTHCCAPVGFTDLCQLIANS